MKIVFTANGRCASAAVEPAGQPITAGSRGVPAEIHLSPDYDGLVVTAFFRSEYGSWPVVLNETPGTVTIPRNDVLFFFLQFLIKDTFVEDRTKWTTTRRPTPA